MTDTPDSPESPEAAPETRDSQVEPDPGSLGLHDAPPPKRRWSLSGRAKLPSFDYLAIAEWSTKLLQRRGYAFYGKLFTLVLCCYFLADVAAIVAGRFIPEAPPTRGSRTSPSFRRQKGIEEYNPIFSRNLFNRQGLIPGEENPSGLTNDPGGAPVRTTLPFNLIGTLILKDELRSIATIEDKSASMVYPVRADEEIPGKARIIRVEPRRVVFVNTQANRREFVELPEDLQVSNARIEPKPTRGAKPTAGTGIEQVSPNQFVINRGEVDKALSDFNNILTQARAVPNFENGVASGYKLFQIVPGSIYDKLGLRNGDVIAGLDGQPINDPGKAFELLSGLKTRSNLDLQIKRDGKASTFSYEIR